MNRSRIPWGLTAPVVLLCAWEILADRGALNALLFPPPSALVAAAHEMFVTGDLWQRIGGTLRLAALGFLIGSVSGLLAGMLMGAVPAVRRILEPMVSALNSTPKLTLLPLLMVLVGVGSPARLVLISLGAFVILAMQGLDAVRGINPCYVELARTYGAEPSDLFRQVYLPASLPMIFTGIRVAMGRALVVTLSAELVGGSDGLGGLIWFSWQSFATDRLYVAVLLTAMMGVSLHRMAGILEKRLIPWRADERNR